MSITKSKPASKRVNFDHFKEVDGEITFKFQSPKGSTMNKGIAIEDIKDDSDEAPDDVSFESSKKLKKEMDKQIRDQIEKEIEIRKGKIRKRQAMYTQQKTEKAEKMKLASLNDKLPPEVLKAVAATIKEKPNEPGKTLQKTNNKKAKSQKKSAGKATKKNKLKKVMEGDYIPLETKTTKFHARLVEAEVKAANRVPENLALFKQRMLRRNVRREPVSKFLAKKNARKISSVAPTEKIPAELLVAQYKVH